LPQVVAGVVVAGVTQGVVARSPLHLVANKTMFVL
jgi:hypothetical protein